VHARVQAKPIELSYRPGLTSLEVPHIAMGRSIAEMPKKLSLWPVRVSQPRSLHFILDSDDDGAQRTTEEQQRHLW